MAKRKDEHVFVVVTTRELYVFPAGMDGRTPDELVEEFFRKYPLGQHHAARDAGRVGNSQRLVEAKVVREEDVQAELGPHSQLQVKK